MVEFLDDYKNFTLNCRSIDLTHSYRLFLHVTGTSVILLPTHPASFAHKFLFQRVPRCNSIADLSLKIVFWTHKFAVGTH